MADFESCGLSGQKVIPRKEKDLNRKKKVPAGISVAVSGIILSILLIWNAEAYTGGSAGLKYSTPEYRVAFYEFDCYHMQDENGKRTGYGYEMMQAISHYMQCTFSYEGYDKSAAECEEMLRDGKIDIYTAAKKTPEREKEFAFSTHPCITASTCMNVKIGNNRVVAGDYSTYQGLKIGLLRRHTYNDKFRQFIAEKGVSCDIIYYDTPAELTNALIDDEVDAVVNSYIGTPEDERIIENFGETPYYIMTRKEDQALVDQLDEAIDCMNRETPNWRTQLYEQYYGMASHNTELTGEEKKLLEELKEQGFTIRAVMNPDENPYSWYENGKAKGIVTEIFKATAKKLGLAYKIIPVADRAGYQKVLSEGTADIWMDLSGSYEDEADYRYKITDPYLKTTVSVLRERGAASKIQKIAVTDNNTSVKEIVSSTWPEAEIIEAEDNQECINDLVKGNADAALMMSYTAQKIAGDDLQNRFRVDIVPGTSLGIRMGVNAEDDYHFFGIWEKTLAEVADQISAEVVQSHLEETTAPSVAAYLFDHPVYLMILALGCGLLIFLLVLYWQSEKSKRRQQAISEELAQALRETEKANESRREFFSKMSHDIRTPLNVVLGMTQVARKYKNDSHRLEQALDHITSEGKYLFMLISSVLDINQLEHGRMELVERPFDLAECVENSVEMIRPLAEEKEQSFRLEKNVKDCIVVGDAGRLGQIMINILSNAVKYTGNGGKIDIIMERTGEERYRFTCTDNGIGMTEEFIGHICEDYVRAEDSRISKTEGTGLGMAVVKGFTDLMNGKLEIESVPGEGSSFSVEIPLAEATEEQRLEVKGINKEAKRWKSDVAGKKVLLVEDNALNAEIAIELLQSIGLSVDWAENGQCGVEQFERSAPGEYFAIFMDMQMPVMDGIEATKQIRAEQRSDRTIPIFAITANTFASDRQKCMDAGMTGYISKPISVKELEDTLYDYVKEEKTL